MNRIVEVRIFHRGGASEDEFVNYINDEINVNEVSTPIEWGTNTGQVYSAIVSYDSPRIDPLANKTVLPEDDIDEILSKDSQNLLGLKAQSGGRNSKKKAVAAAGVIDVHESFEDE